MDRMSTIRAIAVFIASAIYANDSDGSELPDISIADEVRTAYYEHAPRRLAAAMSKAVDSWCSAARQMSKPGASSWLCRKQKLAYFRSVYVTGTKGGHGLVCEGNGTSTLKYFGVDLVNDVVTGGSCVLAEFDGTVYRLYAENIDSDEDA
jgi:hypothetical protein